MKLPGFLRALSVRLLLIFLLFALLLSSVFWLHQRLWLRDSWPTVALPLLRDYAERLSQDIGAPPDRRRAQALADTLPLDIAISGPGGNWSSSAVLSTVHDLDLDEGTQKISVPKQKRHDKIFIWHQRQGEYSIYFSLNHDILYQPRPGLGLLTLSALLLLTFAAYWSVRTLLKPLPSIGQGARRIQQGDFSQPIQVTRKDDLGELASDVNAMANSLHQMLEAKRSLLLAISHELRSPLTRARLNLELLPEVCEDDPTRQALLQDLELMRKLLHNLLEGERLSASHAPLQRRSLDAAQWLQAFRQEWQQEHGAHGVDWQIALQKPVQVEWDSTRMALLLRNLLSNALRYSSQSGQPVRVRLEQQGQQLLLEVRDQGPGVSPAQLAQLGAPFYRTDSARQRSTGGTGLGLYLARLVAQAHGAQWQIDNAEPGLRVRITFTL